MMHAQGRPSPGTAAAALLLLLAASFGDRNAVAEGPGAPEPGTAAGMTELQMHAAAEAAGAPEPGTAAAMTELQKHAAYFDGDHDGIVTVEETYQGLVELGFGSVRARALADYVNDGLGPKTRPDNANSSSRMDIYIVNVQIGMHGSDTGAYDPQGRFVPEKLDEMFAKHGKTVPDAMTKDEVDEMLKANRDSMDYDGWFAAWLEWKLLYKLAHDKDGCLRKGTVRGVYDGSLFYQLAAQRKKD